MKRRAFLSAGVAAAFRPQVFGSIGQSTEPQAIRDAFGRLRDEVFIDAAAGTPLGRFAEAGLQRYLDWIRLGPGGGRREYFLRAWEQVRPLFAGIVGASPDEIGLVHCTKDGEQKVLDALDPIRTRRNVVTNDLHFTGSLHNLVGLRRAGLDLRMVKARNWRVEPDRMIEAIDDNTALVTVSLVSNINGHLESIAEIARAAHRRGALVFADIIQAAGVMPLDLAALGVDFAACSAYKWLYGVHGTGFFYVRRDLQGSALPDRLFPGRLRHNYPPWVAEAGRTGADFVYTHPHDATRYQPGHVSYLGYCGLYESLQWLTSVGVEKAQQHSVRLNQRLLGRLDRDRYEVLSPHLAHSPILTLRTKNPERLQAALESAGIKVSLAGDRLRISPALFNTAEDMDKLGAVLTAAG